ncbi:MAG: FMN-binding negative transcriptional regulator, partial [Usitatibacter sp.]
MTLYVPPHFRVEDRDALLDFMQEHSFATLVSSAATGLHVSHIPFVVERGEDGKARLLGHVARGNAQWSALEGADHVTAIFQGPHAYISPTWYANHP